MATTPRSVTPVGDTPLLESAVPAISRESSTGGVVAAATPVPVALEGASVEGFAAAAAVPTAPVAISPAQGSELVDRTGVAFADLINSSASLPPANDALAAQQSTALSETSSSRQSGGLQAEQAGGPELSPVAPAEPSQAAFASAHSNSHLPENDAHRSHWVSFATPALDGEPADELQPLSPPAPRTVARSQSNTSQVLLDIAQGSAERSHWVVFGTPALSPSANEPVQAAEPSRAAFAKARGTSSSTSGSRVSSRGPISPIIPPPAVMTRRSSSGDESPVVVLEPSTMRQPVAAVLPEVTAADPSRGEFPRAHLSSRTSVLAQPEASVAPSGGLAVKSSFALASATSTPSPLHSDQAAVLTAARAGLSAVHGVSREFWMSAWMIALSSFQFGFHLAGLNSTLDPKATGSLLLDIPMSIDMQQMATGATIVAASIASFLVSKPCEKYGRRKTLLWSNVCFLLGGLLTVVAADELMMVLGRAIVGISVGTVSVVVPMLLSEISTDEVRGRVTALHQLLIAIGIFTAGIFGFIFVQNVAHGWRYLLAIDLIPVVAQMVLHRFVRESPKWCMSQGQTAAALDIARQFRVSESDALDDIHKMSTFDARSASQVGGWGELRNHLRALVVSSGLMLFQSMTGINVVVFYSSSIFGFAGIHDALLSTALVSMMNVLATITAIFVVDKLGPKRILIMGQSFITVSITTIAILLLTTSSSAAGTVIVIIMLLYSAFFSLGVGSVSWAILGDVCPTVVRSQLYSLALALNWVLNSLQSLFSLSLIDMMGGGTTDAERKVGVARFFLLFGAFSFVSVAFAIWVVPLSAAERRIRRGKSGATADHEQDLLTDAGIRLMDLTHTSGMSRLFHTAGAGAAADHYIQHEDHDHADQGHDAPSHVAAV